MENEFNAFIVEIKFLPPRAKVNTKIEACTAATFDLALEGWKKRYFNDKIKIVKGWIRQAKITKSEYGDVISYPMFCPTNRQLTETELEKIKS